MPEAVCAPWRAHAGAASWQDLWARGEREAHAGAALLAELVAPHTGAAPSCRTAARGGAHTGAVGVGLSPVGGTPRWGRGGV